MIRLLFGLVIFSHVAQANLPMPTAAEARKKLFEVQTAVLRGEVDRGYGLLSEILQSPDADPVVAKAAFRFFDLLRKGRKRIQIPGSEAVGSVHLDLAKDWLNEGPVMTTAFVQQGAVDSSWILQGLSVFTEGHVLTPSISGGDAGAWNSVLNPTDGVYVLQFKPRSGERGTTIPIVVHGMSGDAKPPAVQLSWKDHTHLGVDVFLPSDATGETIEVTLIEHGLQKPIWSRRTKNQRRFLLPLPSEQAGHTDLFVSRQLDYSVGLVDVRMELRRVLAVPPANL